MRTDVFDYHLPEELIAQEPAARRDDARMMVIDAHRGHITHASIRDLPDILRAPDALFLNDTRVIPARLLGVKADTGGRVEILLVEPVGEQDWAVLMRCSRRPAPGARLQFGNGRLNAVFLQDGERGRATVRLETDEPLWDVLNDIGSPPLPPYIRRGAPSEDSAPRKEEDRTRYQTVYANEPGAVAAPTAGLHFTPELLQQLAARGVSHAALTLHVGPGTFRPVTAERIEEHVMDSERYRVPPAVAELHARTRKKGGRVVAVGSTSVRTLETVARDQGRIVACEGRADIYIYPPFHFQAVDAMLTNFHLPRSTLLMMVCALGGQALMLEAYRKAVEQRYRFYSYGDCMCIL